MGTSQTNLFPPPTRTNAVDDKGFLAIPLRQWLFTLQMLLPLRLVDTSGGPYSEALPPAGLNSTTGQSNQNQEIIYVKTSSDASTFTLTGGQGGSATISSQYGTLRYKSDGTNWWPVENASSGGGAVAAGTNVTPLPPQGTTFPGTTPHSPNSAGATNSFVQYVPGTSLLCAPAQWKISISTFSASTTVTAQIVQCTPGTGAVLATAAITFGGLTSPTLAPAGIYTSDAIAFPLSSAYDYFIILNSSTGRINTTQAGSGQVGAPGGVYVENSNMIGANPLTFIGGSLEAGNALTFTFQAA